MKIKYYVLLTLTCLSGWYVVHSFMSFFDIRIFAEDLMPYSSYLDQSTMDNLVKRYEVKSIEVSTASCGVSFGRTCLEACLKSYSKEVNKQIGKLSEYDKCSGGVNLNAARFGYHYSDLTMTFNRKGKLTSFSSKIDKNEINQKAFFNFINKELLDYHRQFDKLLLNINYWITGS